MNSKNAVVGDLFVVGGNVNGNASNITAIINLPANDMSSTSMASPPINAATDGKCATEKCNDQSKKSTTKVNCLPNDGNNSSTIGVIVPNGGGANCGTHISKSWYARCNNRWRSQSCDRKQKNMVIRYSWNTAAINRLA